MNKAWAKGKAMSRPVVFDKVDAEPAVQLRSQGKSWLEIPKAHPPVKTGSGKKVRPSVGAIRRAFESVGKVVNLSPQATDSVPPG